VYLTLSAIQLALNELKMFHPFFGQTFLVFKKGALPIENVTEFPIEKMEKDFLEKYYRPFSDSDSYFRVLRANQPNKSWNTAKFPSSGSQSTRTRGKFAQSLIHEPNTSLWAWNKNYITILQELLPRKTPVPAFYIALWLYRNENWPEDTLYEQLVERFAREFKLSRFESVLFSRDVPKKLDIQLFQHNPVSESDLRQIIESNDHFNLANVQFDAERILKLLHNRVSLNLQHPNSNISQISPIEHLLEFLPDYDPQSRVLNGVLYVIRTGCNWNELPEEYGPWTNCRAAFYAWIESGTWPVIWQIFFERLDSEEKLVWTQSFLRGNFVPLRY